jgi:hypothetical protein
MKNIRSLLFPLYKNKEVWYTDVYIAGETRPLVTFHYSCESIDRPNTSTSTRLVFWDRFYGRTSEHQYKNEYYLFRYECLGCVGFKSTNRLADNDLFFSMCYLKPRDDKNIYGRNRFVILQLLLTFCNEGRIDMIVHDVIDNFTHLEEKVT